MEPRGRDEWKEEVESVIGRGVRTVSAGVTGEYFFKEPEKSEDDNLREDQKMGNNIKSKDIKDIKRY